MFFFTKITEKEEIPEDLSQITNDMEKLLRIVNESSTPSHLHVSENMLKNFINKWGIVKPNQTDLICASIHDRILRKREQINMDLYANC